MFIPANAGIEQSWGCFFMQSFSVITATWNSQAGIRKCLDSVNCASACCKEHLVIDNLSTDETCSIARKYPHVILLSEKDSGIYDAMNKGIKLSKNEILSFLNSDDYYLNDTFSIVEEVFEKHPESDIVYGNILVNGIEFKPGTGRNSFGGARIFHPAAFIRRSLFERLGGYDTSYRICADLDFFLRAKESGATFTYIDKPLAVFALGGISTTARHRTAREIRDILIAHSYSKFFANIYYLSMLLRGFAAKLLKWKRKK